MPQQSASATTSSKSTPISGLSEEAHDIYNRCLHHESNTFFTGPQIVDFNIPGIDDQEDLAPVVQELIDCQLFKIHHESLGDDDEAVVYSVRSKDSAKKHAVLGDKERLVYAAIEAAGNKGVWSGRLKRQTNLHPVVLNRCLRALQNTRYIKSIRSRKSSTAKVYMLYELRPSDKVTGGTWYDEGVPDMDFINTISDLIEAYVRQKSWRQVRKPVHKGRKVTAADKQGPATAGTEKTLGEKRKQDDVKAISDESSEWNFQPKQNKRRKTVDESTGDHDDDVQIVGERVVAKDEAGKASSSARAGSETQRAQADPQKNKSQAAANAMTLPDPPSPKVWRRRPAADFAPHIDHVPLASGSESYPTATEILKWLAEKNVIKDKVVDLADLQQLLDMLVMDGRLERMGKREVKVHVDLVEIDDDDESGSESSVKDSEEESEESDEEKSEAETKKASKKKEKQQSKPKPVLKPTAKPAAQGKAKAKDVDTSDSDSSDSSDSSSSEDEGDVKSKVKKEDDPDSDEMKHLVAYEDTYRWVRDSATRAPPVVIAGTRPWKAFDVSQLEKDWVPVKRNDVASDSDDDPKPPPASSAAATATAGAVDPDRAHATAGVAAYITARREASDATRKKKARARQERKEAKVSWYFPDAWDWDWMDRNTRPATGFSETPCARCPRFAECEDGGGINAEECEYLGVWAEEGRGRLRAVVGDGADGL